MDLLGDILQVGAMVGAGIVAGSVLGGGGLYAYNPIASGTSTSKRVNLNAAFARAQSVRPCVPYQAPTPYTQGRVKALLIGINYRGSQNELSGCVNDVHTMLKTLQQIHFPIQECCVLVDEPSRIPLPSAPPTRENIIAHMAWLTKDARPGDVLFFHYSGHGTETRAVADASEAMDQCLCPVDFQREGCIIDDDIFNLLVRPLPAGVRMTAVFDCCHSGSIMDLPFVVKTGSFVGNASQMTMKRLRNDNFSPADVIMFAGCTDEQTSADVSNASSFGTGSYGAGGAATQSLVWALTNTRGLDFAQMLIQMRDTLRQKRYQQVPQLSSTKPINLQKPFSLFGPIDVNPALASHVPQQYFGGGNYSSGAAPPLQPFSPQAPYPVQGGGSYPPQQQPAYAPPFGGGYPAQPPYPGAGYAPAGPPGQYSYQPGGPAAYGPQGGSPQPQYPPAQPQYPPAQPQYPPAQYPPAQYPPASQPHYY